VPLLERLRDSYCALLARRPVKDTGEILAQVEVALVMAEGLRTFSSAVSGITWNQIPEAGPCLA